MIEDGRYSMTEGYYYRFTQGNKHYPLTASGVLRCRVVDLIGGFYLVDWVVSGRHDSNVLQRDVVIPFFEHGDLRREYTLMSEADLIAAKLTGEVLP